MNKRRKPTFGWRGDAWRPATARFIERRLQRRREQLAKMLSIDLSEQEARRIPVPYPGSDERTEGERYFQWRQSKPAGAEIVPRIDLAIEEIAAALRRCWALNRDVNRAGSPAKVRHTLEALLAEPSTAVERWETCDPNTRGIIEAFYPGGWLAMERGVNPDLLVGAIREALSILPLARKGRPKGTEDNASQYLGPALAEIYAAYAEKDPARSIRRTSLSEYGQEQSKEYGPYTDFVQFIFSLLPERLRRTRKGGLKSLDHLVREGVEHIHPPQRPPNRD